MTTFSRAGEDWLKTLPAIVQCNNRSYSKATLKAYKKWFGIANGYLSDTELDQITQELIRDSVIAKMRRAEYSPSTIGSVITIIKLVVHSITKNGAPVYLLALNARFIRLPKIVPEEQNAPCATRESVERALKIPEVARAIAIAAGLGLRVSELLSLHVGNVSNENCLDTVAATIHIRAGKSSAARRSIPVPQELNEYLKHATRNKAQGESVTGLYLTKFYELLKAHKLPPPHSYRRFFETERDRTSMNRNVLKKVMGHAKSRDITDRYSRVAEDAAFVRAEMERCDLGFSLPAVAVQTPVQTTIQEVYGTIEVGA